jgi:hypothetical protein
MTQPRELHRLERSLFLQLYRFPANLRGNVKTYNAKELKIMRLNTARADSSAVPEGRDSAYSSEMVSAVETMV